jgi:hypothetical protein
MTAKTLAVAAALSLFASQTLAQTVVQRSRLGHRVEDIDHIGNQVVTLDGYEVYSIATGTGRRIQKILDLRETIPTFSNGLAWIGPEELFAIVSGEEPTVMRLVASDGTPRPPRTIQYLGGYVPTHVEGLAYIPRDSSVFRGHLILATMQGAEGRLQVMTTAGQVVKEIIPAGLGTTAIAAVTHYGGNRMLVTTFDENSNRIWILDFDGNIVGGPIKVAEADSLEGITELRDGRVAAVDYSRGRVFIMDSTLARMPDADRVHPFAPGLNNLLSVTWDSDRERHVVGSQSVTTSGLLFHAVPSTLDWATLVTYPAAAGPPPRGFWRSRAAAYIPGEKRLAVAHERSPQAILFYEANGTLAGQADCSAAGSPFAIAYIPPGQEFALRVRETNETTLRIVNGECAVLRDLDLGGSGVTAVDGVTYFEQSGSGRFLVVGGGKMWVVDSGTGTLLQSFDHLDRLDVRFVIAVSAITTGPDAGGFAVVDHFNNELVVFRLE